MILTRSMRMQQELQERQQELQERQQERHEQDALAKIGAMVWRLRSWLVEKRIAKAKTVSPIGILKKPKKSKGRGRKGITFSSVVSLKETAEPAFDEAKPLTQESWRPVLVMGMRVRRSPRLSALYEFEDSDDDIPLSKKFHLRFCYKRFF